MREVRAMHVNGFLALLMALVTFAAGIAFMVNGGDRAEPSSGLIILGIACILLCVAAVSSLTIVQPNEAKVINFFGNYIGTVTDSGLWMVLPFSGRTKVSLKVRNFNSQTLKVNDAEGNPIEIGAVVVFRVIDTARALFDVDKYERFVEIQSETALRHTAAKYAYDTFTDEPGLSLRGNPDEVAAELSAELQQRLGLAGVEVVETRLTHLAYAPEIASAMLQRQQATAIIAARAKIVEGAVFMVDAALRQLIENGIELDGERRAAMINNLMVAVVSDRSVTPVINTGTLYG